MVLAGLLSSGERSSSTLRVPSDSRQDVQPEFIYDESQLPCLPPERPNLRDLNNCLTALAAVFPDIQIEVFRELLSHFDGESRLALVADTLLKNRVQWVKGRWRVIEQTGVASDRLVSRADAFRSPEYVKAVRVLALHEFRGLSKSTILAVLAEHNFAYLEARQALYTLSSKSWRFAISSLFMRRKVAASADSPHHPLVIWRSIGPGSIVPTFRTTGNAELDRELYDALLRPLHEQKRQTAVANDHEVAVHLNNEEAEHADAIFECKCCFVSGAFEGFTSCSRLGHMICFRCIQQAIKEALFGQGWLSSIDPAMGTLKCLAVEADGCTGHVPADHVQRALLEDESGADLVHKLDQRLADHNLVGSNLPLIRCPFCCYAEVDDIYAPAHRARPPVKLENKAWADIHVCHESSLVALRTQVEQAMSMAIKRVCPRCNTSFVKNAGCNKLTCSCGYKMCYVCRADLSQEGYRHFCDHFRPDGNPRPCRECNRCNLWQSEDVDQVLKEAREEAERNWKAAENRDLTGADKAFLATGVATGSSRSTAHRFLLSGRMPSLADSIDFLVEVLFV